MRVPESLKLKGFFIFMTYKEKLLDPRWQKKRLEILERDGWTCQLCADTKTTLHIHHFCYSKDFNPWEVDNDALTTYCKHCHTIIEHRLKDAKDVYKVIKNEYIVGYTLLAVFYLCYENVTDIFLYDEKYNKLSFLTCLPSDFINFIYSHFVNTNTLLHG